MIPIPEPLKPEDCPLLKRYPDRLGPVLSTFNLAAESARTLAAKFSKELAKPDGRAALESLARIRADLVADRFKVGFLGPFQCGKSTTLNDLLGQEVSGVGVGTACTSVVTRIVAVPPGSTPKLALKYLSFEEYATRRNTLCEWVGLKSPAGRSEVNLLEMLKDHTPTTDGTSTQRAVLPMDIPYLRAFLQSYLNHKGNEIQEEAVEERDLPYDDKHNLLNHPSEGDELSVAPSKYLLLAESSVTCPTNRIDPEIELVDCPGVGAGRSVDNLLTELYIGQLHGALVFLRADSINSREAGEILIRLHQKFSRNLQSRVWVILNKMDIPERNAKLGTDAKGAKKDSTFDVYRRLLQSSNIPPSQARFGCHRIFEKAAENQGGVADRQIALTLLSLKADDREMIEERLADAPELLEGFEELLKDGGVSSLGDLIRNKIGHSVAGEILIKADSDARIVAADFAEILAGAEKPISEHDKKSALLWENALYILLSQLSGGTRNGRGELFTKIEAFGKGIRTALESAFHEGTPDHVLDEMDTKALLDRFAIDAGLLDSAAEKAFRGLVQDAYKEVTDRLKAENLPDVALAGDKTPLSIWSKYHAEDREVTTWWDQVRPRLVDREFLQRLGGGNFSKSFDSATYKMLLQDKLRTASHQIALGVRSRLRYRLDGLRRQISRKLGPEASVEAPNAASATVSHDLHPSE